jgi:general secretion pathway protein C
MFQATYILQTNTVFQSMALVKKQPAALWVKRANTALVVVIAYALANLSIQFIPDSAQSSHLSFKANPIKRQNNAALNSLQVSQQIASKHLFGRAGVSENQPVEPEDAPETKLNLVLAGVFAYQPSELALAIISSGGRGEEVYGIGDKIVGNATLKAVYEDRVIIENRGQEETLTLPDVTPIALPRVNSSTALSQQRNNTPLNLPTSPRALRDKLVKNPSMLGKIVSATPYQEGGKLLGYRIQPKQSPEILEAQGIMANDVITQVNGIDLNSQKQGIRALRKLVKAETIELTILRDGVQIPVAISLNQ